MPITCEVQRFDYFRDQSEKLGEVSLEAALLLFEKFDFAGQFEEMNERQISSVNPTITYKNSDGSSLIISAADESEFYITFTKGNEFADITLPMSTHLNPEGTMPEDYITLFFDGTLEEHLELREREEPDAEVTERLEELQNQPDVQQFSFNPKKIIFPVLISVIGILLMIGLYRVEQVQFPETKWILLFLLAFLFVPNIILVLTYCLHNYGASVLVNRSEKTIEYRKGKEVIHFKRNDIKRCSVNAYTGGKFRPWKGMSYLWIVLHDGRRLVITNLVADPWDIIRALDLHYESENRTIPFIIK